MLKLIGICGKIDEILEQTQILCLKGFEFMESVILQHPLVLSLALYGIALAMVLFDRAYRATKGIFTLISTALAVLATAYSLLMGASMWECATVLLVFLLLNMEVKE